jgi:hypothetical protein
MTIILIVFAALLGLMADPASESPRPDRWRNLILDQSTPEEAQHSLGNPKADKPDRLFMQPIDKWFIPGLNHKVLRKLTFRGVAGFKEVGLYFRDGKLVVIQLHPADRIAATALSKIYGLEFRPIIHGLLERAWETERHEGRVYPKQYPTEYALVAVGEHGVIKALISNSGFGEIMKHSMGGRDTADGSFPGKVSVIQLISRTLEDKTGADLLR